MNQKKLDKVDGVYSRKFKLAAVQRVMAAEKVRAVADELGIRAKLLYRWRDRVRDGGFTALHGRHGQPSRLERPCVLSSDGREALVNSSQRIAELERKIGRQQVELDFFQQALRQIKAARRKSGVTGAAASTRSSKR